MPSALRTAVMLVLAGVALGVTVGKADASAEIAGPVSDRVDEWVTSRMDALGIPGVAVAIVENGRTIHLRGYGTVGPSGEPVTPATPFLIGSVSKPFTAHIIRHLADDGALDLDEPVLPHLAHLVDDPPVGFEAVTVRHLLHHTGGLRMSVGLPGTVPIHATEDALEHRVRDVLAQPLAAPPGQRYEYSNAGYVLLAAVAEQVTGQRFAELLEQQILSPLGMNETFARANHPAAARVATGHRQWFGRWRPAELAFDGAGVAYGYLGSSARDLARFLQAHLTPDPSLVPLSAAEIAGEPVRPTGWDIPLESGQGLGWMVDELAGHRVVSHAGSLGHFTAHLIMIPDADGLGIAVATNASAFIAAGHEGQYDISLGLARMLLDEEPRPALYDPLLVYAVPIALWGLVVVLVVTITRTVARAMRPHRAGDGRPTRSRRFWGRRVILPSTIYLVVGLAVLLTIPLGAGRHFYPDVGTALTVLTYLALIWGLLRIPVVLATAAGKAPEPNPPPDRGDPQHRPRTRTDSSATPHMYSTGQGS